MRKRLKLMDSAILNKLLYATNQPARGDKPLGVVLQIARRRYTTTLGT